MFTMRFDLRVPGMTPAQIADQYAAAIEMAEWAEDKGCVAAIISEHHASPDGYLPAPLVLATAMAARTTSLPIAVGAALLPLYDPVRLAEEMIVLDHISRGRVSYVFGIGYRPGRVRRSSASTTTARGRVADEKLDTILAVARAGVGGDRPRPHHPARRSPRPVPSISWGGASKAAARRAGSRGLDLFGSGTCDGIEEAYADGGARRRARAGAVHGPAARRPDDRLRQRRPGRGMGGGRSVPDERRPLVRASGTRTPRTSPACRTRRPSRSCAPSGAPTGS